MTAKLADPSLNLYNPAAQSAEQLLAEFIDRKGLLERILGIVRDNRPDRPQQHLILIGPRGLGKTTLLCAIRHRVRGDAEFDAAWLPILFQEEQYGIGDLADFWLESLRHLEAALGSPGKEADRLLHGDEEMDLAEQAQQRFFELLQASGKRALLLVDNLDEILDAIDDGLALHRLRALWMTDPRLMVIGAATSYFDKITQVDQAFHDFFRVFTLERLSQEELETCLRRFAAILGDEQIPRLIEQAPERVSALRILTGGNPRLVKLGYRVLRDGIDGDVRRDLDRLLDESTPFFKHRIESLPKESRRTFDAIARRWDPVTVDDIRRELRKPSNYVSAQVKRLIEEGFVEQTLGGEKKNRYQVSERFYNIYYLMRHSREGRRRLHWLVAFMRTFYSRSDYRDWAKRLETELAAPLTAQERAEKRAYLHALSAAADGGERDLVFATLVRDAIAHDDRGSLDEAAAEGVEAYGYSFLLAEAVWLLGPDTRRRLGFRPGDSIWVDRLSRALKDAGLLDQAVARIGELGGWRMDTPERARTAAVVLGCLSRREEAEAAFRKALELDPGYIDAWTGLGNALVDQNRWEEAEAAFRKAFEFDSGYAGAWNNLGIALGDQKRKEEAEAAFRKALELDPGYVYAWYNLGKVLGDQKRMEEAEAAYHKALELNPGYVDAWNNLGIALGDQNRHPEAEAAYREALELDPGYVQTWNGLSIALSDQNRHEEAEAACRKALELDPGYVRAWNNLGIALNDQNRWEEAEAAYRKALELDPGYVHAWNNLGIALNDQNRWEEAEAAYRKALELDPHCANAQINLGGLYLMELGRVEAGVAALIRGLALDPENGYGRHVLGRHWQVLLPAAVQYIQDNTGCADNLRRALLDCLLERSVGEQRPAVRQALESLEETGRQLFEPLLLALQALEDRGLLYRLAREKQDLVADVMARIEKGG